VNLLGIKSPDAGITASQPSSKYDVRVKVSVTLGFRQKFAAKRHEIDTKSKQNISDVTDEELNIQTPAPLPPIIM